MNETKHFSPPTLGVALGALAAHECRTLQRALAMKKKRQDGLHAARKSGRRLRNLLRFLSFEPTAKDLVPALKHLVHSFSSLRDAHIASTTAKLLAPAHQTCLPPDVLDALDKQSDDLLCEALEEDPDWHQRRTEARHLSDALNALPWQDITPASAKKVLKRMRRKMKRAHNNAEALQTAVAYHQWRRRARNLRYQLEFLRKARRMADMKKRRTQKYGEKIKRLTAITDQLGWRQDFEVFRSVVQHLPHFASMSPLYKALDAEPGYWPDPRNR